MPLDPQVERLLTLLGAGRPTDWTRATVAERRAGFASLMRVAARPTPVGGVEDLDVAGARGPVGGRLYRPDGEPGGPRPALIFFHGGGLVAGDLDTHDALCRALCSGSGCRILSVAYRLAPEHPFPAAVEDAAAALSGALDGAAAAGIDRDRVAVGGDSAGATLATLAAAALRGRAGSAPRLQLLLCPVLDAAPRTASRRRFAEGHLLDAALMRRDLDHYAPGVPEDDPRLSPLRLPSLSGMPSTTIHTAEFDPLRDEGALYATRLAEAGVLVAHRCHAGMIHHFYGLTGLVPAARTILDGIARDLGRALA